MKCVTHIWYIFGTLFGTYLVQIWYIIWYIIIPLLSNFIYPPQDLATIIIGYLQNGSVRCWMQSGAGLDY